MEGHPIDQAAALNTIPTPMSAAGYSRPRPKPMGYQYAKPDRNAQINAAYTIQPNSGGLNPELKAQVEAAQQHQMELIHAQSNAEPPIVDIQLTEE